MALYERLAGRDETGYRDENLQKISNALFSALLLEYTYDAITRQQIIDTFGLDATEQSQLDTILAKGTNQANRRELYNRLENILRASESGVNGYALPSQLQAKIAGI